MERDIECYWNYVCNQQNKTSNEWDSRRIPNSSLMNQVVQPKKVPKSKKNGNPVENMSG